MSQLAGGVPKDPARPGRSTGDGRPLGAIAEVVLATAMNLLPSPATPLPTPEVASQSVACRAPFDEDSRMFVHRWVARRGVALAAILTVCWSSIALAAPAVIKRTTEARSAPFVVAPILEVVRGGARVTADEQSSDGWRRVQLPSGKYAFVRDEDVELTPGMAAEAPSPSDGRSAVGAVEPLASHHATPRAPLYVGNAAHLVHRLCAPIRSSSIWRTPLTADVLPPTSPLWDSYWRVVRSQSYRTRHSNPATAWPAHVSSRGTCGSTTSAGPFS